jgi:hypothetical protein
VVDSREVTLKTGWAPSCSLEETIEKMQN